MKLLVVGETGQTVSFEVDKDCEVASLKALIENELAIPVDQQTLLFNGQEIPPSVTGLYTHGVRDNDMLLVRRKPGSRPPAAAAAPAAARRSPADDPEVFRQQLLMDPALLSQVRARNPAVAEAVNDAARFAAVIQRQLEEVRRRQREEEEFLDPFDIEVQRRLEEAIRQQNVNSSLEQAMEYAPETFGRVFMLYINCEINGHKVKAFVDSGAQMTIMSSSFAEKCGLSWYLDTRYTGVAKGVGSARILGRIHMSPIKIGHLFLPCSFTVLEEQSVDLLLGLDMLRRHQAIIDLKANVLRIGEVETPFLGEADLPESARERPEDLAEAEHLANSAAKRTRDTAADLASSGGPAAAAAGASGGPAGSGPSAAAAPAPASGASSAAAAAAAAAAAPAAAKPAPAPPAAPAFPEDVVQSLMALGVSREQAVAALQAAGGNPDLAAGLLF